MSETQNNANQAATVAGALAYTTTATPPVDAGKAGDQAQSAGKETQTDATAGQSATKEASTSGNKEEQPSNTAAQEAGKEAQKDGEADQKPEVPESYEFKKPEGFEGDFNEEVLASFGEIAKKARLSQDQAQEFVDFHIKQLDTFAKTLADGYQKTVEGWAKEVKEHPEIGGAKYNESVAIVGRLVDKFATPEFRLAMDETGWGNHPQLVVFLHKVAKAMEEDTFKGGTSVTAAPPPKSAAAVLYPQQAIKQE